MKANYLELRPIIYEFHEFRRESQRLLLTNIELWIWFNCVLKVILWNLLEPYFFWQFVSNIMRVVDNINCPAGNKQTWLLNAAKLAQCICNFICQSGKSKVFNYNHTGDICFDQPPTHPARPVIKSSSKLCLTVCKDRSCLVRPGLSWSETALSVVWVHTIMTLFTFSVWTQTQNQNVSVAAASRVERSRSRL